MHACIGGKIWRNLLPKLLLGIKHRLRRPLETLEADPLARLHALRHQNWLHLVVRLVRCAQQLHMQQPRSQSVGQAHFGCDGMQSRDGNAAGSLRYSQTSLQGHGSARKSVCRVIIGVHCSIQGIPVVKSFA